MPKAPPEIVLAFDTSTARGGVAVLQNGTTLRELIWERQGSHAELLTPAIEKCLSESQIKLSDVDALAIGQGPGSFTGVRVAINAARTFGFSLNKPTYAFDTTEIIAAGISIESSQFSLRTDFTRLAVLVNAHKNSVYTALFSFKNNHWERTLAPTSVSIDELGTLIKDPHLCLGDGYVEYADALPANLKNLLLRESSFADFPLPSALGRLVASSNSKTSPLVWNEIQALYIRDSGAEEKLRESPK